MRHKTWSWAKTLKTSTRNLGTPNTTTNWNVNVLLDDLRHGVRHFHQLTTQVRHCDVGNKLEAAATVPLVPHLRPHLNERCRALGHRQAKFGPSGGNSPFGEFVWPTGVNLNRYTGPRTCIRWHSDNEPLFGPQYAPQLIVSVSLDHSVEFQVRRRAPGNEPSSITLDHSDLVVMDGLAQSECAHARCLGCRVLGLTLHIDGSHSTLRHVHQQAWWVVFSLRVSARFGRAGFPRVGG